MKTLIFLMSVVGVVYGAPDVFRFTQCECPNFIFSSDQGNVGPITVSVLGDTSFGFKCPGDDEGFPEESGILTAKEGSPLSSLVVEMPIEFLSQGIQPRNGWYIATRYTSKHEPGSSKSFVIFGKGIGIGTPIEVFLSIRNEKMSISANALGGRRLQSDDSRISLDLRDVVGSYELNVLVWSDSDKLYRVCAKLNNGVVPCFNFKSGPFFFEGQGLESVRASVMDVTSPNENIIVSLVQIDKDVPVPTEIAANKIFSSMPRTISLPVVKVPQIINGTQDFATDFDISSFLSGGDVDLDQIRFSVADAAKNGILRIDQMPNLTYTPRNQFVGEDSFNFSYSISEPFECGNNVQVLVQVESVEINESSESQENPLTLAFAIISYMTVLCVILSFMSAKQQNTDLRSTEVVNEDSPKL